MVKYFIVLFALIMIGLSFFSLKDKEVNKVKVVAVKQTSQRIEAGKIFNVFAIKQLNPEVWENYFIKHAISNEANIPCPRLVIPKTNKFIVDNIIEELSTDNFKEQVIASYMQNMSKDEMRELNDFYIGKNNGYGDYKGGKEDRMLKNIDKIAELTNDISLKIVADITSSENTSAQIKNIVRDNVDSKGECLY